MSIAITTASPSFSPPALAGDSAISGDTGTGGFDFASLLLGQLAASAGALNAPLSETTGAVQGQKDAENEPAPEDAAQLLAALGFVAVQPLAKDAADASAEALPPAAAAAIGSLPATARRQDRASGESAASSAPAAPLAGAEEQSALAAGSNALPGNVANATPASGPASADASRLEAEEKAAKIAAADLPAVKAGALPAADESGRGAMPTVASSSAHTTAHPTGNAPLNVGTPLREAGWSNDFSQKIVWMANNDRQTAQITLNPPQMGPIDISLTVGNDSATALFVSANAEVRETIEAALPRLREMLAGAGIELGQASVSDQSPRQQANQDAGKPGTPGAPHWQADNAILGERSDGLPHQRGGTLQHGSGLVDTFA